MDDRHPRLSELNNHILDYQNLISSSSKSHSLRVLCVRALAEARFSRYSLSEQQDDLDGSILGLTEVIFLPLPGSLNIVQIFWNLTVALSIRAKKLKQPEDVKCCIMFLRYVQDVPPGVIPDVVTAFLVDTLVVKVELELGDVQGDIEEIVDLCHKLLNSDSSQNLNNSGEEQKIIQFLREGNMRLPDLHPVSIAVSESLLQRFQGTGSIDDYEEGTAILDEVVAFRAGDTPSPYQEDALLVAGLFAEHQLSMSGKPDHLEEAIYRARRILDVISPDHPLRPSVIQTVFLLQKARGFDQADIGGSVRGLHPSNLESPSHRPFKDLTTSLTQSNMDTSTNIEHHIALLSVGSFSLTDMSEIEDAVKYCRQILASPLSGRFGDVSSILVHALIHAHRCTNDIEYLNEAISVLRDLYTAQRSNIQTLLYCLSRRFRLLYHGEDLNELIQLCPIAAGDISSTIPDRFEASCEWAYLARFSQHPSTPTAYDHAISFMQASLTFSPTLHSQHLRLVARRSTYEKLPSDYASYLVHRGQLKKAIENLERGRTLMWSEMRGFRISIDEIHRADSDLAGKFAAVNRELEMLTLTSSSELAGGDCGIERTDPYGDLVLRQQGLLDDRERLISQIQTIPGFKNFLEPLSFDTLRSAALYGPVIVINHCAWRSDILILLHDSPPSLLPTGDDFYDRANELRDQLLDTRRKGLESDEYEKALNSVLKELYELVGRPVIERLNELHIPEQSRIWWCPTSAFCSLPLHAMGPIPLDDGSKRYFMDLYIPSYIPSLSALIKSRKPSQTLDKPSILLVVQPDEYMPGALKEMKVVRAVNTQVTTLFSKRATPTAVLRHLRDHRFAHIVCHGTLEVGKPFDASFKLYAGERLSLLDTVRSQLPDAEFAFLSACHTAELTEESIADEGLHLTAAMQYCGFRSAVGTLWAMADTDGRDLARDFYKLVFADERHCQGVRHYERTAEALRDAVQRLRRKGGITSERWVNFVHYGA